MVLPQSCDLEVLPALVLGQVSPLDETTSPPCFKRPNSVTRFSAHSFLQIMRTNLHISPYPVAILIYTLTIVEPLPSDIHLHGPSGNGFCGLELPWLWEHTDVGAQEVLPPEDLRLKQPKTALKRP